MDLAIVAFWLKLLSGIPSCKSLKSCSKTNEASLSETLTGNPEITTLSSFVSSKTKPVLVNEGFNSVINWISPLEKYKYNGNNNCWLDAKLTVILRSNCSYKMRWCGRC